MKSTKLRLLTVLTAIAVLATLTMAAATGTKAIQQRQKAMEEIGGAMKALGAIAKKEAPFDATVVQSSAKTIVEHLKKSADLFPEGSDAGEVETWSKAEIWSDREGFNKDLEGTMAAALALEQVTEEADFLPALGALGNGCKSCHDTYRRPKS